MCHLRILVRDSSSYLELHDSRSESSLKSRTCDTADYRLEKYDEYSHDLWILKPILLKGETTNIFVHALEYCGFLVKMTRSMIALTSTTSCDKTFVTQSQVAEITRKPGIHIHFNSHRSVAVA